MQEREQEEDVGARPNAHVLSHLLCGLGTARVDRKHRAATRHDALELLHGARQLHEAHVGNGRVGAEENQALGTLDVDDGLQHCRAVHLVGYHELVVAVLRTSRVAVGGSERGQEQPADRDDILVADVPGHAVDAYRVEHVHVGAGQSGGMGSGEFHALQALDGR